MDKLKLLEYIAAFLSCTGSYLNANKEISGFYVWFVGSTLWMWLGVKRRQWGVFLTFLVFSGFNVYGILMWSGLWPAVIAWIKK